MDGSLNFEDHIRKTVRNYLNFFRLSLLYSSVRNFISVDLRIKFCDSLSKLYYADTVFGGFLLALTSACRMHALGIASL